MSRLSALNSPDLIFEVRDVLSLAECQERIKHFDLTNPLITTDGTATTVVRHNARTIEFDAALACAIFDRVRHVVPQRLVEMVPVGANECIRYYRYRPGDYFSAHQDTHFQRSANERSLLTVVVYLNEGYEGGALALPNHGREIVPRAGAAVVFGHRILHASTPLVRGVKYALRSDIMYRSA